MSDVTDLDGLLQAGEGVAGRDELVAHPALVADVDELPQAGREVDLLIVVEFPAAGVQPSARSAAATFCCSPGTLSCSLASIISASIQ